MRRLKQLGIVLLVAMNAVFLLAQTETFPRYRLVGGTGGVPVEVDSSSQLLMTTTGTAAAADSGLAATLPRFRLAGGLTGNLAEVDSTGHLLVAGTTAAGLGTSDTPQFAGLGLGMTAPASGLNITSALNHCLSVGPNGTTTPMFDIDCSVASAATGIKITPTASGSGVTLAATGGTNEALAILAKGSGNINIGTTTNSAVNLDALTSGSIVLKLNSSAKISVFQKNMTFGLSARSSGVTVPFVFTGGTDTNMTAATEAPDFFIDMSQTKQHASNTTVALQRSFIVSPPVLTFASNGGVYTEAANLALVGPPTSDANNTIASSYGLYAQTRALTGVTNGFGVYAVAPTGATTNYAAKFSGVNGVLFIPPATQTIADGDTIVADSCGGTKNITAAGGVTTNTTNTFTAPAAANTGCSMMVCNVGAQIITLDKNANVLLIGGINLALAANSCVGFTQSTGTEWRQTSAQLTAT